MILELLAALVLGALLLWMALSPRTEPADTEASPADIEFDPLEETPKGRALLAIKELEFDRETGKIAEPDYQTIRARLTWEAVKTLDDVEPASATPGPGPRVTPGEPTCPRCGPRPEPDALFCSKCGGRIGAGRAA